MKGSCFTHATNCVLVDELWFATEFYGLCAVVNHLCSLLTVVGSSVGLAAPAGYSTPWCGSSRRGGGATRSGRTRFCSHAVSAGGHFSEKLYSDAGLMRSVELSPAVKDAVVRSLKNSTAERRVSTTDVILAWHKFQCRNVNY
uniref:Uncharacterized protein n=1 Tax=Leersia perrieri TaxID=77586 RepID=A0A0D9V0F8_9ORYZ